MPMINGKNIEDDSLLLDGFYQTRMSSRRFTQFISSSFRAMSTTTARTPINLVSVNTAPDRAKIVIGKVIENVKDKYQIVHAGNTTSGWKGFSWKKSSLREGKADFVIS
jgi:hypothetical protein